MAKNSNGGVALAIGGVLLLGVAAAALSGGGSKVAGIPLPGALRKFNAGIAKLVIEGGTYVAPGNLLPRSWVVGSRDGIVRAREAWDSWQNANEQIILSMFLAAGYPLAIAQAAVANAAVESALDHLTIGDNGKSVGLFQLNAERLGRGLTVAQRQDPQINTQRILDALYSGGDENLVAAYKAGAPSSDLAAIFARDIERCKHCGVLPGMDSELHNRASVAAQLYDQTTNQDFEVPEAEPAVEYEDEDLDGDGEWYGNPDEAPDDPEPEPTSVLGRAAQGARMILFPGSYMTEQAVRRLPL